MAPKAQLQRQAWLWAEVTSPADVKQEHVIKAYRLDYESQCYQNKNCRKNCRGNPLCLSGLGERKWLSEIDDKEWCSIEDPEEERRKKDNFVGLKNLGATCYINTLLQVWFHNMQFRNTIFKYKELPVPDAEYKKSSPKIDHCVKSVTQEEPRACDTNNGSNTEEKMDEKAEQSSETATNRSTNSVDVPEACTPTPSTTNKEEVPNSVLPGEELSVAHLEKFLPKSPGGHLQLIFALLQYSERRYIDPSHLISFLRLDAELQQDAQEFSNLFISVLEKCLSTQTDEDVRSLIQSQFHGRYDYVTVCRTCRSRSERMSQFYELDLNIEGHTTLHGCLKEFLEVEELIDDNQYMCASCQTKRDAERRILLKSLPPVLNLQLLRFVYDRKTARKKKLNTFIQFPEKLDMGQYMDLPEGVATYDLISVLIHRGPSAYSGHYIAHIKNTTDNMWYKFNDETIEKMGAHKLHLGNEEDISGEKAEKGPRKTKGFHSTKNGYMLVYVKSGTQKHVAETKFADLPQNIQSYVKTDNLLFDNWIEEMQAMQKDNIEYGRRRQEEIASIYEQMRPEKDEEHEWLMTDWIEKWMTYESEQDIPTIDNSDVLCCHNRLDPNKVDKVKCISVDAGELLHQKYGGGIRLNGDMMCFDCVKFQCNRIWTKVRLDEDQKQITKELKAQATENNGNEVEKGCFWIGKTSLKSWKRLALDTLEPAADVDHTDTDHNTSEQSVLVLDDAAVNGGENLKFNSDVLCEHNDLNSDETSRRLVSASIWNRLHTYFPGCPVYPASSEVCAHCQIYDADERTRLLKLTEKAAIQKSILCNLYLNKNRPTWKPDVSHLYLVSTETLKQWRNFIREPTVNDEVTHINNDLVLCPHKGIMFDLEIAGIDSSCGVEYLTPDEWSILIDVIPSFDTKIEVTRCEVDGNVQFIPNPLKCEDCLEARAAALEKETSEYQNAQIYIRPVTDDKPMGFMGLASPAPNKEATTNGAEEDSDFTIDSSTKKRKKTEKKSTVDKKQKLLEFSQVRRSNRHHKTRGEVTLTVSSSQKLLDLKMQVMHKFSVLPIDQHLLLNNDIELFGNDETLADLNVTPNAILYLKIDEPAGSTSFVDEVPTNNQPEMGFTGTGLLT